MKGVRVGLLVAMALAMVLRLTAPAQAAMVGHWKMDETSWNGTSNEVTDSSGSGNNGTAVNGPTTVDDGRHTFWGRQGSFDGSNDRIDVPDASSLDLTTGITIAAWINLDSIDTTSDGIMYKPGAYALDITTGGEIRWVINDVSIGYSSSGDILTGQWYHVAAAYDGANWSIFKDGSEVATGAYSATIVTNDNVLKIAEEYNSSYNIHGLLDDVRLYNNALSESEIQGIMAIPEPSTMLLFGTGLLTLTFLARRRKG